MLKLGQGVKLMNKKDLIRKRKNNRRLYPIYSSLGLDYMFYYGIKVLFLSQIKGITNAEIVLATSFYALFAILTQIPVTIIIDKIGKRKGLILGNALNTLAMLLVIICPNFIFFIFEELISSTATNFKATTEASILDLSIPKFNKKGEFYTKLKRNGYSKYCYMYAASTVIAGWLYTINPYIPVILCMGFCLIATIISFAFAEIKESTEQEPEKPLEYLRQLNNSFKFIFKSARLRALLIMLGVIWGLLTLFDTYQVILLKELSISSSIIGIVLAVFQVTKGRMSRFSGKLNTKFKNKTLTTLALMITISFTVAGAISLLNIKSIIHILFILIAGVTVASSEGIYQIIKSRYLNNFATSKLLPKIYGANTIINNLFRMVIGFIGSLTLSHFNIKYTMIIIGVSFTILVYFIYIYMKPRVGLKPDQYKREDIEYKYVKTSK